LSGVWKFERIFLLGRAHQSVAHFRFDYPGRSPRPARRPVPSGHAHRAESHSAPVTAGRRCPTSARPFILAPRCHHRRPPNVSLPPPTFRRPLLAALLRTDHRFTRRHQPTLSHLRVVRPNQNRHTITTPLLRREPAHGAG
jgi:hypothetical protein